MLEIRALRSFQRNMNKADLAALLAEDEMACGLPCVVESVGEAAKLLGLNSAQAANLERALSTNAIWKGVDRSGALVDHEGAVCIRRAG